MSAFVSSDGSGGRRTRPPLTAEALERLAIHYVGRYATTRAKLRTYLARKVAERGWDGDGSPQIEMLAERCAARGYIDDAAFAAAKGAGMARRGYGLRRVDAALRAAGIAPEDAAPARAAAEAEAWDAALAFARRRRFGPFARNAMGPDERRRAFAAMIRAGHDAEIARRLLEAAPGAEITAPFPT